MDCVLNNVLDDMWVDLKGDTDEGDNLKLLQKRNIDKMSADSTLSWIEKKLLLMMMMTMTPVLSS